MGLFGQAKTPDGGDASGGASSSLDAYDAMLAEHLAPLRAAADAADAQASSQAALAAPTAAVEAAFAAQRAAVASAAASTGGRPADAASLQALLAPVAAQMTAAAAAADRAPPRSAAGLAARAAAEALQSLSWLALPPPAVSPSPAQHVADAWSAAEFYANKLMMEARGAGAGDGGAAATAWVRALKALVATGLKGYVAAHHPRGLAFGGAGGGGGAGGAGGASAAATASTTAAAAAPAPEKKRAPPPPPPPGGPPPTSRLLSERKGGAAAATAAAPAAAAAGGMSAVLASLNRGTAVTSGLRKVTDDMKAKNRADRTGAVPAAADGPAAATGAPAPSSSTATAAAAATAPRPAAAPPPAPRVALEQDRRWVVEHHVGSGGGPVVVRVTDPRQAVYVRGCGAGAVVRVEGRVASLTVDACRRAGVVFDDVVAAAEVVNCAGVQLQCLKGARTVSVDNTDGCQVFVPRAMALPGAGFQLVTAKSSEVNLTVVPGEEDDGDVGGRDAVEHAVPEQFVSTFGADGKLATVPASHGGG